MRIAWNPIWDVPHDSCDGERIAIIRSNDSGGAGNATLRGTGQCLMASIAVGGLLLTRCAAFHAHVPPVRRRLPGHDAANSYSRCPGPSCARATRAPEAATSKSPPEVDTKEAQVSTSAVFDDLDHEDPSLWKGHEYGFDWYLEKTRRKMMEADRGGFSPLRMNFWRPVEDEAEELGPWDSLYIIMRNLGQMVGFPSVDNAPVAKIDTYKGSWITFLQKVSNGRLEDLAGGPLFLMLEKYFLAEGDRKRVKIEKIMYSIIDR